MILIVENDEHVRDVTVVILRSGGYDASAVSNGEEALEFLANNDDVELVLTDIVMPLVDGFDLFLAVRAHPRWAKVPFLIMTGGCPPSRVPTGVRVLRKPFRMQVLLDSVRAELDRAGIDVREPRSRREPTETPRRNSSRPPPMV